MKFPSNLNCDGKIVSEMGPRPTKGSHSLPSCTYSLHHIVQGVQCLIHCSWVMHLYALITYAIIGSDNGLILGAKPLSEPIKGCHWTFANKFQWNLNQNAKSFIQEKESENKVPIVLGSLRLCTKQQTKTPWRWCAEYRKKLGPIATYSGNPS